MKAPLSSTYSEKLKPYCCGKCIELSCRRCAPKCCFPRRSNRDSAVTDTRPSREKKAPLPSSPPSPTPSVLISGREIESFNWVYRINCPGWHSVLGLAALSWPRERIHPKQSFWALCTETQCQSVGRHETITRQYSVQCNYVRGFIWYNLLTS